MFLYQCLILKSNFKILKVAARFERRQNDAKNDKVVLYKVQMYNVY